MRRLVVVALAGIAVLGVGSVALIAALGGGGGRTGTVADAPSPPPASEPIAPLPAATGQDLAARHDVLARPAPPPQRPTPVAEPPPPPPPGSWESVDPVARPSELGAIGPAFMMGLRNAAALERCFDPNVESRHASTGALPTIARDGTSDETGGPPVLMLQLETLAGAVRIVDAPVETRGRAGDGVHLCAQAALRGLEIPVAQARAGERHRMRYALVP